jgi:C-terminal processing protease CtpA/Prc
MRIKSVSIATLVMMGLLLAGAVGAVDEPMGQASSATREGVTLPSGVIGISLQIGAERIGDPAVLYVGMVHPEGPAHQAGLRHGDQIMRVDGTSVTGKSFEEVVKMIRGEAGTVVKLGVKGEEGPRELSITRVPGDKLSRGPAGSHGGPPR